MFLLYNNNGEEKLLKVKTTIQSVCRRDNVKLVEDFQAEIS